MGPRRLPREDSGGGGFYRHDVHPGLLLLQILPHPGDGAPGAHTGYEDIHSSVGVGVDLRPGGLPVGFGVGGVDKLSSDKAVGNLLGQCFRLVNGPLHPLGPRGEHQLRAIGGHQLPPLQAHAVGHDNDEPVAPGCRHRRQADAGVAAGGLNDHRPRLQQPPGLCVVDHR